MTLNPLRVRLSAGKPLVSDGAMGTWLIGKGLQAGECPDAVSLNHREWITEISSLYRDAGADLLQANTFGASPLKLEAFGLQRQMEEINRAGISIAREAARGEAYVAASCGPSGRLLEPYGDTAPSLVLESFARQMKVLSDAGADALLIETMTDLNEALLALKGAKDAAPHLPVWVTLTFDVLPRGFFTMMGQTIPTCVAALEAAGADAVGSNCGNGIEAMTAIAREFKSCTRLPVIIQANAGLPEIREGRLRYPEGPEYFGRQARSLMDSGVAILGGCCGTTPDHIRAFRAAVDSLHSAG